MATRVLEARQAVGSSVLQLRFGGQVIAEHAVVAAGAEPQWLPEHRSAAEALALGRHGRHLRAVPDTEELPALISGLELGVGDYDVDDPDLECFGHLGPHPDDDQAVDIATTGLTEDGWWGCECSGASR